MIGLDTNVLLRLFVNEGGKDAERARRFVTQEVISGVLFVSVIVLVEFVWTLRAHYGYSRNDVRRVLSSLLASEDFRIENELIVKEAFDLSVRTSSDFPDALVALAGREAGCRNTATLDAKAARRLPHMEAVP